MIKLYPTRQEKARTLSKLNAQTARISRNLAKQLRVALAEKGLTQVDLADACGVTKASVSDWLHGRSLPSLSNLHRISAIVDRGTSALLGEKRRTHASLERLMTILGPERIQALDQIAESEILDATDKILAHSLAGNPPVTDTVTNETG